ncbi:MAG: site-specific integrase [Phycisphaerae bacterium]|nr:site-specific integrase [Phycisphaerae bacterium]
MLERGLAEATVRRRCKRAKQFFSAAIKKRLFAGNPFDEVPTADRVNVARQRFISCDDIYRVIEACPDTEWRLVFALARFGGLRIPSELLPLTWDDINWAENKFLVHSPKTEHIEGKDVRLVPLFPALLPYLQEAFDQAEPGQKHLITRFRHAGVNLGTQAHRIIVRAGLKPWPKTFQNLRASCETELVEDFPIHVVTAWLGNSPEIAKKHYLQVTEDHFRRAVEKPTQNLAHIPAQHTAERSRSDSQQTTGWDLQVPDFAATCEIKEIGCGSLRTAPDTPTGTRTPVSRMRT